MKVAVLADSHGNSTALEAVLMDAKAQGAEKYITVGDMVMKGPSPERCLSLLEAVEPIVWVIGNHESCYMIEDEPYMVHPKFDMSVIYELYDKQYLSAAQTQWLANLPLTQTVTLLNTTFDIFHALPDDPGSGAVFPTADQDAFDQMLAGSESDVAIYGHVHRQTLRMTRDDRTIINPGTIGLPTAHNYRPDNRAQYVMLEIAPAGIAAINYRRVEYDVEAEIAIAKQRELPYLDLYIRTLRDAQYSFTNEAIEAENMRCGYDRFVYDMFHK